MRRGVLTVHVPLVLVLDERVTARLPRALVVHHVDLSGQAERGGRNRRRGGGGGVGGGGFGGPPALTRLMGP